MLIEPIGATTKGMPPLAPGEVSTGRRTTQETAAAERATAQPDPGQITEIAANLQKNLNMIHNLDIHFSVHQASGVVMVTVTDESTGEVIREFPPSEVLVLAARLEEMVGLLFDQKG